MGGRSNNRRGNNGRGREVVQVANERGGPSRPPPADASRRPRSPSVPPPDVAAARNEPPRRRPQSPSVPPPDVVAAARNAPQRRRPRSPSVPPPDVVAAARNAPQQRRRPQSPSVPPPDVAAARNAPLRRRPRSPSVPPADRKRARSPSPRRSPPRRRYEPSPPRHRETFRGGRDGRDGRDGDRNARYGSNVRRDIHDSREYRERIPLQYQPQQRQQYYSPPQPQQQQYHRQQYYQQPPQQQQHYQQRNYPPQRVAAPQQSIPHSVAASILPPPPPPPPIAPATPEEQQTAAEMVRAALPLWRSERVKGKDRLWAFDPRVCCWNANMVAAGCVDARTCRCTPLPGAPALSRTILHDLLPRALPVLERQFGAAPALPEPSEVVVRVPDGADDTSAAIEEEEEDQDAIAGVSAAAAEEAEEEEEEEEDWSLPLILEYQSMPSSPPQQQKKRQLLPQDDDHHQPCALLGSSTGQLAFRDGVLFPGRRFVPAARGMPPPPDTDVFDQTCAFPFGYEPFRPDEDASTLVALRRLLLDRFWGPDADVFLAYLAAAYTGSARGKMVISAPGAAPPLICTSDDAELQRRAAARHTDALARWERHCNTGPQYLERLLRLVHSGGDAVAATTSHVVECDTYRRFTRRMPLADCQAWASVRAHHRLMWIRPAEMELMFMPSAHQPGAPAFGPAVRGDRRLASLRKLQALARIDAPRTVELLRGVGCGGTPPAFGAFLMWPRPVLPVLDGFVAPNAPGTPAAENCWLQPLAARLRTVTHTAWTSEDEKQQQGEESDWAVQLDRMLQTTPQDVLRRAWVELLLRAAEKEMMGEEEGRRAHDCWPRQSRLSPFVIGPLGYPAEMLAQPRASDLALMQVAPRVAQIEAVRQDNIKRGLVPRFGGCWELAARSKNA